MNMTQSSESVKSKGVLLFATDTKTTKYTEIARRASRFIEVNLGLPVNIVSGNQTAENRRFSVDSGQFETWKNFGRCDAYKLSPWDQTILLDCDYIVLDNNLLKLLDTVQDYALHDSNVYLDDFTRQEPIGAYSLPMLWATVVVFNRTEKAKLLFDLVARIERNYPYYCKLYNITNTNFRNDFAFTIADNIINGYSPNNPQCRIPWPLITASNPLKSIQINNNKVTVKDEKRAYVLPKQNLHIISKEYLLSDNFGELVP